MPDTPVANLMAGANSSKSPLDVVSETVGEPTTKAFETLGNETRLAILLALWEAKSPGPPVSVTSEPPVSFSELRERVGIRDSGQFNYHLDKLTGTFVESTDEGYLLTTTAEQVLGAVFAGTLADQSSFEGEPIDAECGQCGGPLVIDYNDGIILERCTSCEGVWQEPGDPPGTRSKGYLPPVGLENRTPQEFHRKGNTWTRHRLLSMMEGVCPRCTGTVTTHMHVCEDHDADEGTICEQCGSEFEFQSLFTCDVCKLAWWVPARATIFTEVAVKSFFHEHGLDYDVLFDTSSVEKLRNAFKDTELRSDDPFELAVTVELGGDRLEIRLDGDARVIDLSETELETN